MIVTAYKQEWDLATMPNEELFDLSNRLLDSLSDNDDLRTRGIITAEIYEKRNEELEPVYLLLDAEEKRRAALAVAVGSEAA